MRVAVEPVEVADIRTAAWRRKFTPALRPSPLGLALALLLYNLVNDKVNFYIDETTSHSNPIQIPMVSMPIPETMLLRSEFKRRLADVQRSMVALPDQDDAWTIAKVISETRMSSLTNDQIISEIDEIKTNYASFVKRFEKDIAKQQGKIEEVLRALQIFNSKKDNYADQVMFLFDHDSFLSLNESNLKSTSTAASAQGGRRQPKRDPEEEPLPASAYRDDITGGFANSQSRVSDADLFAEPSLRFAALQIARKLHEIRGKALLSRREKAMTIDVERGLFGEEESAGEFLQLDPGIELRLDTAASEVINEDSARIRFFPDGSATGGRIQLQSDGESATVDVAWSTGAATVQVKGN